MPVVVGSLDEARDVGVEQVGSDRLRSRRLVEITRGQPVETVAEFVMECECVQCGDRRSLSVHRVEAGYRIASDNQPVREPVEGVVVSADAGREGVVSNLLRDPVLLAEVPGDFVEWERVGPVEERVAVARRSLTVQSLQEDFPAVSFRGKHRCTSRSVWLRCDECRIERRLRASLVSESDPSHPPSGVVVFVVEEVAPAS